MRSKTLNTHNRIQARVQTATYITATRAVWVQTRAMKSQNGFERQDESPDERFYAQPRFVSHIDAGAIAAVTNLYREFIPDSAAVPNVAVLDLMASWISHFPTEARYARAIGLGMNRAELERNPKLTGFVVQDLNQNPRLPFEAASFDAACCCVSIDYLTDPVAVLREVSRVLKNDAPFVVSFSNRCFPSKAVRVWLETDDEGHLDLIESWMLEAGNWAGIEKLNRSPGKHGSSVGDPLWAVVGRAVKRA